MRILFFASIAFLGIACESSDFAGSGLTKSSQKSGSPSDKDDTGRESEKGTGGLDDGDSSGGKLDLGGDEDYGIEFDEFIKEFGNDSEDKSACQGLLELDLDGVTKFFPNLVPDGDFEKGNGDITSDYNYDDLSTCFDANSLRPGIGSYSIVKDPSRCHRAWDKLDDSKIAIFNGAVGDTFWCRTFKIQENTKYAFSVDERILHPFSGVSGPNGSSPISWLIDGKEILPVNTPTQKWVTRGVVWESQEETEVTLCGKNTSTNNSGNDWGIDNICLVKQ